MNAARIHVTARHRIAGVSRELKGLERFPLDMGHYAYPSELTPPRQGFAHNAMADDGSAESCPLFEARQALAARFGVGTFRRVDYLHLGDIDVLAKFRSASKVDVVDRMLWNISFAPGHCLQQSRQSP